MSGSAVAMNALSTVKRLMTALLLVFVGIGGVLVFRPLLQEKRGLEVKRDSYREDNDRMNAEIARLRRDQALFARDPDFVEKIARKANRVRPNEVVFVFPTGEPGAR